jgi:beta-lactamase class A
VTHSITRRKLLIGLPVLAGMSVVPALHAAESPLADIERRRGGRLGVFAIDTGSGRTLSHRADERFLMCSTFKGLLAAQILARVDSGAERLDRVVRYTKKDLIFTSPVTKANVARGALSIDALYRAILVESDNTAAILLMRSAGGPAALTRFVRSFGDTATRSDRYEPDSNRYCGVLDTTTPKAIATTAQRLLLGDVLSASSRAKLEHGMTDCKPGLNRIRAVLPAGWQAADRPGTSVESETNDYALVRPPGRAPLLVAVYYEAPGVGMDTREAVLREAGTAFVQWATSAA